MRNGFDPPPLMEISILFFLTLPLTIKFIEEAFNKEPGHCEISRSHVDSSNSGAGPQCVQGWVPRRVCI